MTHQDSHHPISQPEHWNRVAPTVTFSHPLETAWLDRWVGRSGRILDFGCGYGRTLNELHGHGYACLVGVDAASAMIERGRASFPRLDLRHIDGLPLAEPDGAFDAILLLAVLTCIADDASQRALAQELRRLLKPRGVLFLSDMPLQSDARHADRYVRGAAEFGRFGVFRASDGAVVRHHDEGWLDQLFGDFDRLEERRIAVRTMNGNPAVATQRLLRRAT